MTAAWSVISKGRMCMVAGSPTIMRVRMEQISFQIIPFIDQSNRTVGFQFMISSAWVLPRAANSFSELFAVAGEHLADHGWERLPQSFFSVTHATNT